MRKYSPSSNMMLFSYWIPYHIVLFLIALFIYMSIYVGQEGKVFANSPSFPIQNIVDNLTDWGMVINDTDWYTYPKVAENEPECLTSSNIPDIDSVNYFSDGKYLNATIWFFSPIEESDYDLIVRDFVMQIDVRSTYDAFTADYGSGITWNNKTSVWTKELVEYETYGDHLRLIKFIPNDTSLQYGKNFVSLSLNLDDIHSPDEYLVLFAAQDTFINNGKFCKMLDTTDYYPVPPPNYNISTSETSVFLKPGQEKKIELKIKTDARFESIVSLVSNSTNGINLEISPPILTLPPNSIVTSLIKIRALENATVRPYTSSITSTIYPNQTLYSGTAEIKGIIRQQLMQLNIPITVTLEEPIGLLEYINNTLTAWGAPIKEFIALVTTIGSAAVAGWIFLNKYRTKNKSEQ